MGSAGPRSPSSCSSDPSSKSPQLVPAQPCATWATSGACSTARQMFHCRPWVGAVPIGCRRSVRAQVLSCTDCSRARVRVYHRTWAGGTAAPSLLLPADPGPRLDPRSQRAPSPLARGGAPEARTSGWGGPALLTPSQRNLSPPPAPSNPHHCSELIQDFSPARTRDGPPREPAPGGTFPRLPWPGPPRAAQRGPQVPGRRRATWELLPPPPPPPPRDPAPPAPYPQPRGLPGLGGRRRAPGLGRRGPLPRVRTWPGLRPLHSARRLALTAPPARAPPAARRPASAPPGRPGGHRRPLPGGPGLAPSPLSPSVRFFPFPVAPSFSPSLLSLPTLAALRPTPSSPSPTSHFPLSSLASFLSLKPRTLSIFILPQHQPYFHLCLPSGLWVWFAPVSAGCFGASRKHRQSPGLSLDSR